MARRWEGRVLPLHYTCRVYVHERGIEPRVRPCNRVRVKLDHTDSSNVGRKKYIRVSLALAINRGCQKKLILVFIQPRGRSDTLL